MKKKRLYIILILYFTGIFILGAYQIYRQLREYGEGDSVYTDIEQYVSIDEEPEDDSDGQENESQSGESRPNASWPAPWILPPLPKSIRILLHGFILKAQKSITRWRKGRTTSII